MSAEKKLYRVNISVTYSLLAVGESSEHAELAAEEAIKSRKADCEIDDAWANRSCFAMPVTRLDPDDSLTLPWGGEDNKHCEDYLK